MCLRMCIVCISCIIRDKILEFVELKHVGVVVEGDCVLMRPFDSNKTPYVAKVENIEADHRNNVKVWVRWYYRPEESIRGRRQFHGAKELFLSDHFDVQSANTSPRKVHCTFLQELHKA